MISPAESTTRSIPRPAAPWQNSHMRDTEPAMDLANRLQGSRVDRPADPPKVGGRSVRKGSGGTKPPENTPRSAWEAPVKSPTNVSIVRLWQPGDRRNLELRIRLRPTPRWPTAMRRQHPRVRQVRAERLLECERLQGFPDGFTDVGGAADGSRYKALGNSMAVPVLAWIGERIRKAIGE